MIGTKLGSYEIIEEVGKGGMATVYRAYQPSVDRFVAVKVIRQSIAEDPQAMARFQREARVVARLEHPHVLPIHDFAHDPPYIVMRYLEGGTLKDVLRRGRLPLDEVGYLLRQVAAALDYAHRQGVVHRDVKPSNILIDGEGNAFVSDFGIARIVSQGGVGAGQGLTQSGSLMGTPGYMAPEQAMGCGADHRADLYSLAVVVFEILSGQLPYRGETPMDAVFKHVSEPVPSACALNDSLPAALDEVLRRAMAKDPAARYGTASELAEAIVVALGGTVAHTPRGLQEAAAESVRMILEERKERRGEDRGHAGQAWGWARRGEGHRLAAHAHGAQQAGNGALYGPDRVCRVHRRGGRRGGARHARTTMGAAGEGHRRSRRVGARPRLRHGAGPVGCGVCPGRRRGASHPRCAGDAGCAARVLGRG